MDLAGLCLLNLLAGLQVRSCFFLSKFLGFPNFCCLAKTAKRLAGLMHAGHGANVIKTCFRKGSWSVGSFSIYAMKVRNMYIYIYLYKCILYIYNNNIYIYLHQHKSQAISRNTRKKYEHDYHHRIHYKIQIYLEGHLIAPNPY